MMDEFHLAASLAGPDAVLALCHTVMGFWDDGIERTWPLEMLVVLLATNYCMAS